MEVFVLKNKIWKAAACAGIATLALSTTCLAAEGRFKVGFDAEFPPFSYMDESGEYTGLDIDLAKAVAELEGWEFIPAPIVWDSRDQVLDSGEIDCIWSAYGISGREDSYAWTVPYINSGNVFLVKDSSGIETLADLSGKVVGVQSGSSSLESLLEGGEQAELGSTFKKIWQFANSTNAFMALINNQVDAVVNDAGVLNYYVGDEEGYKILSEPLSEDGYCGVAFLPENTAMRDTVDEALKTLTDNGTVAEIAAKYHAEDIIVLGSDEAPAEPAEEETTEEVAEEATEETAE